MFDLSKKGKTKMYCIKKSADRIADICDPIWETAERAVIDTINWGDYASMPRTEARLLYSDYALHVRMETDEKPLLARHTAQNSTVCCDSCMELFIRPNENDKRYINMEFNPFGTMYLGVREGREGVVHPDKTRDYFDVKSHVDDEKWVLQFSVPFEFIDEIFGTHTRKMYANLYKCGDETECEHYVSYAPIESAAPDFHRPESFVPFVLEY